MNALRSNQGVAIVYVTLFLLVLGLLFVALGVDVGWMIYVKTQAQRTVDAAALRAAAAIPNYNNAGDTSMVYSMATGVNAANTVMNQDAQIGGSNIELCADNPNSPTCLATTYPTPAGGVKVTKAYSAPLFLSGRLLNGGNNNVDLNVSSIAWLGGPGGLTPDLPMGMCQSQVGYPNKCSDSPSLPKEDIVWDGIGNQSASTTDDSAWWTPIDVQTDASDCRKLIQDPSKFPLLHIDDLILRNNGQVTSCLNDIANTYAGCPSTCDPVGHPECTRLVPVFDCAANPNQSAPVVGFAKLCITEVKAQGTPKYIKGPLICNVPVPGAIGGGAFFGIYASRPVLVK